ncbi:MAG TPA: DOMON-like domain-containing protein [Allosphingosinicella sp.]|jgi:hypothetical protein
MMDRIDTELWAHPAEEALHVETVRVSLERLRRDHLALRFEIVAPAGAVILPPPAPPLRSGHLWETTCFEMFVRARGKTGYREFNFSPSCQWAAYEFADYRDGMTDTPVAAPPIIAVRRDARTIVADVELWLDLPEDLYDVGLCAIVEEQAFGKSYWALSHGGSSPDFHHRSCFALELPPPTRP